jgi:hypothetical protein
MSLLKIHSSISSSSLEKRFSFIFHLHGFVKQVVLLFVKEGTVHLIGMKPSLLNFKEKFNQLFIDHNEDGG